MVATPREPLEHYLDLQYPVQILADPEGGYVALFPDLPGCMTQGETLEEVAAMAEDARRGWIQVEYERGADIPLPSFPVEYSGKFNIRIPRSLHRALAVTAEQDGVSLNQYVVSLLSRGDAQARLDRQIDSVQANLKVINAQLSRYALTNAFKRQTRTGAAPGRSAPSSTSTLGSSRTSARAS